MPRGRRYLAFENAGLYADWEEQSPYAFSFIYYCYKCGDRYGKVVLFIDGKQQPYKAITGKCHYQGCDHSEDNRYIIPGHIRHFDFPTKEAPAEVHQYEFNIELRAFDQRHKELEIAT